MSKREADKEEEQDTIVDTEGGKGREDEEEGKSNSEGENVAGVTFILSKP